MGWEGVGGGGGGGGGEGGKEKSRKVGSKSMVFNRVSTPQIIEKSRKSRFQINGFQ